MYLSIVGEICFKSLLSKLCLPDFTVAIMVICCVLPLGKQLKYVNRISIQSEGFHIIYQNSNELNENKLLIKQK